MTHLPQIAAYADAHFQIAKRERDGRTVTAVERLDREGRIRELAQMLGEPREGRRRWQARGSCWTAPMNGDAPWQVSGEPHGRRNRRPRGHAAGRSASRGDRRLPRPPPGRARALPGDDRRVPFGPRGLRDVGARRQLAHFAVGRPRPPRNAHRARATRRAGVAELQPSASSRIDPRLLQVRLRRRHDSGRRCRPAGSAAALATAPRDTQSGRDRPAPRGRRPRRPGARRSRPRRRAARSGAAGAAVRGRPPHQRGPEPRSRGPRARGRLRPGRGQGDRERIVPVGEVALHGGTGTTGRFAGRGWPHRAPPQPRRAGVPSFSLPAAAGLPASRPGHRSSAPRAARTWMAGSRRTPCAIRSQRICSRVARTCASSRSCWGMPVSARHRFTLTSPANASARSTLGRTRAPDRRGGPTA